MVSSETPLAGILETEYRTKGILLPRVSQVLGVEIEIPRSKLVQDKYTFLADDGNQDRIREAVIYENGRPLERRFYQHGKRHPGYGIHLVEKGEKIEEGHYRTLSEQAKDPVVIVQGVRRDLWISPEGQPTLKKHDGWLHFCFDFIYGLGSWTEFEIVSPAADTDQPGSNEDSIERIFTFAKRLGLSESDLTTTTYPQMLLNKRKRYG